MSIEDFRQKIKGVMRKINTEDVGLILVILLVSFASFGLGRLSNSNTPNPPITIQGASTFNAIANSTQKDSDGTEIQQGSYVASKNSNKYHLPWCSGAKRISEKNKIWFANKTEAEAAGYTPAGNCKGI
ncbi:MAG TPA: hypothetical protein ENI66_01245 [Candidatus Yonathbacteria bacterium]|nr:hypothetical protein [Candidatus Yonathbacteria bacterium]